MSRILVIFFAFGFPFTGILHPAKAQAPDARQLVEQLRTQFEQVTDYQADIRITVDVSFINIPDREATVYFKQPDKMHVDSKGFTLLPKKGMNAGGMDMIRHQDYTALYIGESPVEGHPAHHLKVLPNSEAGDVVLAELWLAQNDNRLLKMKSFTQSAGMYNMRFFYADHPFQLPAKMVIQFDIKDRKMPGMMTGDFEKIGEQLKTGQKTTGRVIVEYDNYQVNQGLDDTMFSQR